MNNKGCKLIFHVFGYHGLSGFILYSVKCDFGEVTCFFSVT